MTTAANARPAIGGASLSASKSEPAAAEPRPLFEAVQATLAFFGFRAEARPTAGEAADGKKKSTAKCDDEKDAKAKPPAQNGGDERREAKKELLYLAF